MYVDDRRFRHGRDGRKQRSDDAVNLSFIFQLSLTQKKELYCSSYEA